ncbi:hypothetical protein K1T71_004403 [Dendrolimus kikuchii]|uniref:Uncharacterized protein n=1 Tax=Dendrolimus kikuchii TaxID=765133 RepID=A0ACC1D8U4_9NEOP|nr:hypothetical protein K1T71_004403 [Dendrolimus kikuchii]
MHPLWILLTLLPVFGEAERFNCKGRILGAYYADAKSGCKAFHVCVRVAGGGIRDFRFFCPPGTLFHQEAQTCTDWGDDDPLACPADIYDGQFDLYRIGSGYDTRKLSSPANREDEPEFGLQRAETGDRRLSQNNVASNGPASDLRAAHSSDFFTGQRDRGRDDSSPLQQSSQQPQAPRAQPSKTVQNIPRFQPTQQAPRTQQAPVQQLPAQPRQSFRRVTTPRAPTTAVKYTPASSSVAPEPSKQPQYDFTSKRKLVRKRPVYASSPAPTPTFPTNTPQAYSQPPQQQFNRRIPSQNRQTFTTPIVPPQFKDYKDEYVEVSRVTPKPNRFFPNNPSPTPSAQSTPVAPSNKKEGLGELYNYDTQSTPGLNVQNDNRQFNARNSFSVSDVPRENDFIRTKNLNNNFNGVKNIPTTTADYNAATRGPTTSTQTYKNFNSVSYEPEKNNFVPYSKQNNFFNNNPTTTQTTTTTFYTTLRPEPSVYLNTVAYNTNNAFGAQTSNYAEEDEDDGQYRPPQGEDDGQYRPELYERELLSGAHSLNIAASGNRLPEDQKSHKKPRPPKISQTAVPRPFRPAPIPNTSTTRASEPTFTSTQLPQTSNTQRTFDLFQTYTTTSRPTEFPEGGSFFGGNNIGKVTTAATAPRVIETRPTRPQTRPSPPTIPPTTITSSARPTTRHPPHSKPQNKEDTSYDYAYYDSDSGFSEYDHIEEFGRTKKRAS